MFSRRQFVMSTAATCGISLPGCSFFEDETPRPQGLPDVSIDIHSHVFNATDIPVPGFLRQVFLRAPEEPVTGNYTVAALIRLLTDILLLAVRTASEELAILPTGETPADSLLAHDKRVVAQGIREFSARNQSFSARSAATNQDAQLIGELGRLANRGVFAQRTQTDLGGAVADAIFDAPTTPMTSLRVAAGDFDLGQTLRWAALLTRDRRDILGELIRLYGPKPNNDGQSITGIQAFSTSLVDFEYWFLDLPQNRFSPLRDQLAVMSRLAQDEQRAILLNFAPFCPLRAAIEGNSAHQTIRNAIRTQGFVGVKLYPPMGFKPIGNAGGNPLGGRAKVSGAAIDRELRRMYRWCAANGVPIKAHGNNSLAASECSGQNAAPDLWDSVLSDYPDLRVNIAHFGGFEEDDKTRDCNDPPNYEERAAALIAAHENAYVDLGYWTEVAGRNRPGTDVLGKVNTLLAQTPRLGDRIMYGSDYSMIGRERSHGAYLADVKAAVDDLQGTNSARVFALNAQSYLQLDDPNSPTRQRLRQFFPTGHVYFAVFGN